MTFRHLEIFMSVYQNRSITKASKELHISQPSVSLATEFRKTIQRGNGTTGKRIRRKISNTLI